MEFYEGRIFRPPSEASSLILQVTVGCSHNRCTFCDMYKEKAYREKSWAEIETIVRLARQQNRPEIVKRIFLADGDALAMEHAKLMKLLDLLSESFPYLERVGIYAGPRSILNKSDQQLQELRAAGLSIAYLGLESGSDRVLKAVKKGVGADDMIKAGKKMRAGGIKLSLMVLSGLGGNEHSRLHARQSAQVVNAIQPDFLAVLTLRLSPTAPIYRQVERKEFTPLKNMEVIQELRWFIEDLQLTHTVFRSNHASNYLVLAGILNKDKELLLAEIDRVLTDHDYQSLRPESWRQL